MIAGWLLAALLVGSARAEPADALDPVQRNLFLEAGRLEEGGEASQAALRYRAVLRAQPDFLHARLGLARALLATGDAAAAEEVLRDAPWEADAVEALGRLYLESGRPEDAAREFRKLQALSADHPDSHRLEAVALAAFDPHQAALVFRRYLGFASVALDQEGTVEAALAVLDALREASPDDDDAQAHALLEELFQRWPGASAVTELEERRVDWEVEELATRLQGARAQPLTPEQRRELDAARAALASGRVAEAEATLRTLRELVPRSADVWAALSEVHEAQGEVAGAERAVRTAERLDPLDPSHPARLGDLLATWYGGRFDLDAAEAYGRALRRNPAWAEVWARKARLEHRAQRLAFAEAAWRRYLQLAPDGLHAADARRFLDGTARERPDAIALPPLEPSPVPDEASRAYYLAEANLEVGRRALAREHLARARDLAPRFTRALNLEAKLLLEDGDREAAIAIYRSSLEVDPRQPRVLEILLQLSDADTDLERAAELGVGDAHFLLARRAHERWKPWAARDHLAAYFRAQRSGDYDAHAQDLRAEVDRRIRALGLSGVAGAGLVAFALPLGLWRRRAGSGLPELLDRAPAVYPVVARIGSAIRHEVLKHNTTVLGAVANALDEQDQEPLRWAAEKIYGPRGVLERFREHVAELERLGRVHGVRLNLRWQDATFGPLIAAMDRLGALEREVRRGGGRRLAAELRDLSRALNEDGYRALGRLIRRVCLLRVDEDLLGGIWRRVAQEPDLVDQPVPDLWLDLPAEPILLRVFRGELEDILANVLRNSTEATLKAGEGRLGLRVTCEEDDITGLERVAFRVTDDAPRRISTAVIRGRYIERGLGLTVDLISRNGGSIHVEDEPGWSKAVVVRLPRAELPDEEEG